MKKPRLRLHFHLFDGKTPLWWVTRRVRAGSMSMRLTTNGFTTAAAACQAALKL